MAVKNYREVGIFDLLCAPLNPIGAFDAEQFKKDVQELLNEKKDEKYLAVDLSGLDFVYSDAYNAFIQFQEEMERRGGQFSLLTSNKTIIDGLKKAGLDKRFQILASEEDMMSFSLHAQNPTEQQAVSEDAAPAAAVASQNAASQNDPTQSVSSQNATGSLEETKIVPPTSRPTGNHRRFTKSFNAIPKDEDKPQKKGLDVPFDDEPSSARTVIVVILLLLIAIGATLAFFYIK